MTIAVGSEFLRCVRVLDTRVLCVNKVNGIAKAIRPRFGEDVQSVTMTYFDRPNVLDESDENDVRIRIEYQRQIRTGIDSQVVETLREASTN